MTIYTLSLLCIIILFSIIYSIIYYNRSFKSNFYPYFIDILKFMYDSNIPYELYILPYNDKRYYYTKFIYKDGYAYFICANNSMYTIVDINMIKTNNEYIKLYSKLLKKKVMKHDK